MNDLQITHPATPWAFLTVFHRPTGDHEEGETSVWAFGDMAATHEAERIIESISGVDFTRRRSAEISPIEVENLWTACGTAANDTGELLSALSARGEVA
ncbi:hypothetical protein J7382_08450 [Shimia sp. R11_0]|uniref:hypothetical protein n=1 Tax=Shimia sp. R11_0 TaxID=2821096 RepID=UPI001ADC82B4|nr:hypothetical protein [Shimia sp. R11_0]MBO9477559.1 hypothetical protein [Shimia sp. R11_0]